MKAIQRLCFLIHGFCYAEMAAAPGAGGASPARRPYLERENRCAARWRAALRDLGVDEGLAIIPWPGQSAGPSREFNALAVSVLGDRCFILDAGADPASALRAAEDARFEPALLDEFRRALDRRPAVLNQEELDTAFHSLAVCSELQRQMAERGYECDAGAVSAEAWGASFDGCVLKYSLNLRRMLGLARVIGIPYGMTVPDAAFLLSASEIECILLADGLRLFIFQGGDGLMALYTATAYSFADGAVRVRVPLDPETTTARSKQGIRLWPDPDEYVLRHAPAGYAEPPQQVVRAEGDGLVLPVSAGLVYRLARGPAYVFAPPGMAYAAFRDRLTRAGVVG